MSKPLYEPSTEQQVAQNKFAIKDTRQHVEATRWYVLDDGVVSIQAYDLGPALQAGFVQLGSPDEHFAFRLNRGGSLETKGVLDVSAAASGDMAWTMPGPADLNNDPYLIPFADGTAITPRNQAFSLRVSTTGDSTGVVPAAGYIDSTTGDVTISWNQSGLAIFEIKVFEDDKVVTAGNGKFKFDIPEDLDTSVLVKAEAWVTGASGGGTIIVQLRNDTASVDMLSTPLTIDVGELNSKDATPHVVDLGADDVAWGDEIWVNVDNAGSGALGLGVAVYFTPSANAAIVLQGAKGDPGGVTSYQGAWTNTTAYQAGDVTTHNGVLYVALQDHTSNAANDEPGVGANWTNFWAPAFNLQLNAGLNVITLGGGYVLTSGIKGTAVMPFSGTILSGTILADIAGSAIMDIWKSTYAGYPPTIANTITGATPLTLTSQIKNFDSTLAGWTTALAADDILVFVLSGVSLISRLTVALKIAKD